MARGPAAAAAAGSTVAGEEGPGSKGRVAGVDLPTPILARSLSRTRRTNGGKGRTL